MGLTAFRRWGWLLTSPCFVVSVVVLVVNDHVGKQEFPGLITGKLSDVAGVAMLAMLFTAGVGRPRLVSAVVAVCFAALKTAPAVADLAVPVLGGRTLTDATDLVALLALIPLASWMRRADNERAEQRTVASVPLRVVAICAAVLATSATSCAEVGVLNVRVDDGRLIAITGDDGNYSSADGGQTWERDAEPLTPRDGEFVDSRRSCVGEVCFEVRDFAIERVVGDERAIEYTLTEPQIERLVDGFRDDCSYRNSLIGSVVAFESPDGLVAVASMGEYGVIVRSLDGSWNWAQVGDHRIGENGQPLGRDGFSAALMLVGVVASMVLLVVGAIVAGVRARNSGRSVTGYVLGVAGGLIAALVVSVIFLLFESFTTSRDPITVLWVALMVTMVLFGVLMVWLAGRRRPEGRQASFSQPPPPSASDRRS